MSSTEPQLQAIFDYAHVQGFSIIRIQEAYRMAEKLHREQKRKSGAPYISHVIAVTHYLVQYHADEDSLIAGFLHDAVEDTPYTLEEVEKDFGVSVRKLIHGMTKFAKTDFAEESNLNRKIESLRKWFEVMQDDIRVGVIKIFDRLHNMETLNFHGNPDKEREIAKETLDIHVKIARKLGLYTVKHQLEQLCLPYIDPNHYETVRHIQDLELQTCERMLNKISNRIQGQDTDNTILAINHHPLTLSDVYEFGLHTRENTEANIPLIVSITTTTIKECYYVLYLLHSIWKMERGSFEDFINTPAVSGYRGLHSRVLLAGGREVQFKIMTKEMKDYRHYGVTTFCFLKEQEVSYHKLPQWISHITHVTKSDKHNSNNFWAQLQNDILAESITVYTDKGKEEGSILLPSHATALDAAFYAYGERGLYVDSIHINGKKVPLYHHLKADDTLRFNFGFTLMVTYEWVQFVDTSFATSYIKEGLKTHDERSKSLRGKEILEATFQQSGKGVLEELQQERIDALLLYFSSPDLEHFLRQIAEGEILPEHVVEFLYPKPGLLYSNQRIIKARGSFTAVHQLFQNIPEDLKSYIRWSLKTKGDQCHVTCITANLSSRQWKQLLQYVDSTPDLTISVKSSFWDYRKLVIYIPLINILFGLEPIIALWLLEHISPPILTMIRFVSSSFFLYLFIIATNPYRNTTKQLPIFNPIIIMLALLLAGSGFATYQSLAAGTSPSLYLLSMQLLVWVMLLSQLLHHSKRLFIPIIGSVVATGIALWFLYSEPNWNTTAQLWMLGVVVAYGLYSMATISFRRKEKVEFRQQHFLLLVFIYAALFSILGLFLTTNSFTIGPLFLLLAIGYSIIFTCAPFILYSKLLRPFRHPFEVDTLHLNWIFVVGFVSELVLLRIFPSPEKIIAIVAVYTAAFLLIPHFRAIVTSTK